MRGIQRVLYQLIKTTKLSSLTSKLKKDHGYGISKNRCASYFGNMGSCPHVIHAPAEFDTMSYHTFTSFECLQ
jgi:hypothetical protein